MPRHVAKRLVATALESERDTIRILVVPSACPPRPEERECRLSAMRSWNGHNATRQRPSLGCRTVADLLRHHSPQPFARQRWSKPPLRRSPHPHSDRSRGCASAGWRRRVPAEGHLSMVGDAANLASAGPVPSAAAAMWSARGASNRLKPLSLQFLYRPVKKSDCLKRPQCCNASSRGANVPGLCWASGAGGGSTSGDRGLSKGSCAFKTRLRIAETAPTGVPAKRSP